MSFLPIKLKHIFVVEEPCQVGCSGLLFCSNFNYRSNEMYRMCNKEADQVARYVCGGHWVSSEFLYATGIPYAIACNLTIIVASMTTVYLLWMPLMNGPHRTSSNWQLVLFLWWVTRHIIHIPRSIHSVHAVGTLIELIQNVFENNVCMITGLNTAPG